MKAYKATFRKKDGSLRKMLFCKLKDIPDEFIASKISGEGKSRNLSDKMELVLDLEADNFRVFNWDTVEGVVQNLTIPDNYFDL